MTLSLRRRSAATLVALVTACGTGAGDAGDPYQIDRDDVERVITALAADDMRGRNAFTDDARRAAEYLASEFAAAGLQSPDGAEGYLQTFTVRSFPVDEARVVVDGVELPRDRFVVRLSSASIDWSTGDVEVVVVGPEANVRDAFIRAVRRRGDVMVLLDEAHASDFEALASRYRRPLRVLGSQDGSATVVALVNGAPASSIEVMATAAEEDMPISNVLGVVPGRRDDEYVLFSAHYDHIGIRPAVDGDSIANGANDDASGTTAVVTLARYFASRDTPERTLLFAAFTAEEGGGFGSRYFSSQLNPDEIVAMFNIEMIGKPAVEGPNTAWITGFERSSFGTILQEAVEGTGYEFYPDPYPEQNLFYRSDNATLARLGVPAHSISTTPIDVDTDYHRVTDHVETLDIDHMTNTIRGIAAGAERIVSGEATPTRIDPETVTGGRGPSGN